jgi:hypothetical protein
MRLTPSRRRFLEDTLVGALNDRLEAASEIASDASVTANLPRIQQLCAEAGALAAAAQILLDD